MTHGMAEGGRTRVSAATLKLRQSTQVRGELQLFSSGVKYEHVPPSLLLAETPRSASAWLDAPTVADE